MGRARRYATNAERQRAFRRRLEEQWARVDRGALDHLHAQLDRLQQALFAAKKAGDATARRCSAASVHTLLDRLADYFEARVTEATSAEAVEPPPPTPPRPNPERM